MPSKSVPMQRVCFHGDICISLVTLQAGMQGEALDVLAAMAEIEVSLHCMLHG